MKTAKRTCIIIAGMHRSGTSALARVFNLLGCELPKTMIGVSATNETGYWESQAVISLNDALLESAGSSWDDCTPCTLGWFTSPRADEYRERSIATFEAEYGNAKLTILKEPRICRLLPFWLNVIETQDIEPLVVLPIRNPLEVAASLAKRDLSDPFYNHHLWLRHVLDSEQGSRGKRRFFCGYGNLLDSWSTVISGSEKVLDFKWPRFSPKASEEIDAYISTRHRHHSVSPKDTLNDIAISVWLRTTYEIMLRWIETGENEADYPTLDAISEAFDAACTSFARILYRGKQAVREVQSLRIANHHKDAHVNELAVHNANLEDALNESQQEVGHITHEQATQGQQLHEVQNQFATVQHERNILATMVQSAQAENELGRAEIAALQTNLSSVTEEGHQLRLRADELESERNQRNIDTAAAHLVLNQNFEQSLANVAALEATLEAVKQSAEHAASVHAAEFSAAVEASQHRYAALEIDRSALAAALSATQFELKDVTKSSHLLAAQLEDSTQQTNWHQQQLAERSEIWSERVTALSQQLEAQAAVIAQQGALLGDLDVRLLVETNEKLALQDEIASKSAHVASLEDAVQGDLAIIDGLKAHVDLLLSDVETAQHELVAQTGIAAGLRAQIDEQELKLIAETNEKLALQDEIASKSAHVASLEDAVQGDRAIIDGLKAHVNLLSSDVETAQVLAAEQTEALANETATLAQAVTERDAMQRDLSTLNARLTEAEAQGATDSAIILGLKAHIDLLTGDVDAAQADTAGHQLALDTLRAELDSALKTAADNEAEAHQKFAAQAAEIDNFVGMISNLETQIGQKVVDLQAAEGREIAVNEQLQGVTQRLDASQSKLEDHSQADARNQAIINGLKQHVHLLMGDVDAAQQTAATEQTNQVGLWRIIDQTQADLAAAEQREVAAQAQIQELEHAMAHTESALRQRSAEATDLHQDFEAAKQALEAQQLAGKETGVKLSSLSDALAQRETDLTETKSAIEALKLTLQRQAKEHQNALYDKEAMARTIIAASTQTTQKLRGQISTLVRGLAEEKHAYFQRKSATIERKAALLVAAGVLDVDYYLSVNQDIVASGVNPAVHYLTAGIGEGRAGAAD